MSVADKLTQIAENEQRVYKAGANDVFRQIWEDELTTITIPKTVTSWSGGSTIGSKVDTIYFDAPELADGNQIPYQFGTDGDGYTLIIGKNVESIPARFCYSEPTIVTRPLKSIEFEDGGACSYIGKEAFYRYYPNMTGTLYVKGSNMEIANRAFQGGADSISKIKLKGVSILNDRSFAEHKQAKTIIFLDIPQTVHSEAFIFCDSVTDIYVPWSKGEVKDENGKDNAPWGASSTAKVHYDYPTNIEYSTETGEGSDAKCLIVEGEGAIPDFAERGDQLWDAENNATKVIVKEGITEIGMRAFAGFSNGKEVSLPTTLTKINPYAFDAFGRKDNSDNWEEVDLPDGLEYIGERAFQKTGLQSLTIPSTVTNIAQQIVRYCPALKTINFEGKPDKISKAAFEGCDSLTIIKVPWSKGKVANAPWGATNATILYNYVG